jgi:hypothetical protein
MKRGHDTGVVTGRCSITRSTSFEFCNPSGPSADAAKRTMRGLWGTVAQVRVRGSRSEEFRATSFYLKSDLGSANNMDPVLYSGSAAFDSRTRHLLHRLEKFPFIPNLCTVTGTVTVTSEHIPSSQSLLNHLAIRQCTVRILSASYKKTQNKSTVTFPDEGEKQIIIIIIII